jgi:N-methylhydantoinase A
MALSLGIDIGGTFTDIVLHDPVTGRATIFKESTTPDDPARGALIGAREVLKRAGRARLGAWCTPPRSSPIR